MHLYVDVCNTFLIMLCRNGSILSLFLWIMFYDAFSLQVQYQISISYLLLLGLISCGEEIMYNSWTCIGGRVYPPRITALMTLLDVTSAYNGRRDWIHSLGGCMMKSNVWIGIWLTSRRINILYSLYSNTSDSHLQLNIEYQAIDFDVRVY